MRGKRTKVLPENQRAKLTYILLTRWRRNLKKKRGLRRKVLGQSNSTLDLIFDEYLIFATDYQPAHFVSAVSTLIARFVVLYAGIIYCFKAPLCNL